MGNEQQFKRIAAKELNLLKQKGIKITALTAYDFIIRLNIPTYGIGTGLHSNGQIIVSALLLG